MLAGMITCRGREKAYSVHERISLNSPNTITVGKDRSML